MAESRENRLDSAIALLRLASSNFGKNAKITKKIEKNLDKLCDPPEPKVK